jgi:signal transduction histidine kinase
MKTLQESGFGLAGIRERARLLGGRAVVESRLSQGAPALVELPNMLRTSEPQGFGDAQ